MLIEEALAFFDVIGKQRLDFAPVAAARANLRRAIDDIALARKSAMHRRHVKLVVDHHRRQALVLGDPLKRDSRRRRETGGAAMTQFLAPLHIPVDLVLRHAEIMLQDTAHPKRRRLLVLSDPDALPDDISGLLDAGINVVGKLSMHEAARWKDRNRDHVHALRLRDQIGRERHLGNFELLKLELAPERLRRIGISCNQLGAFDRHSSINNWFDSLIGPGYETEL